VRTTSTDSTTNADDNDALNVYQQRIKELEDRLEEQFARAQYESMDKSMSDTTSTQLRRSRRAQRDAEKQLTEVSERLSAALARAGEAERSLASATEQHERIVRELTESAAAQCEEAKHEAAAATAAAIASEAAAAAKSSDAAALSKMTSERDVLQRELDAARRTVTELQKEHEHMVQVVAAANAARTKSLQTANDSRSTVDTLRGQLQSANERIHALEAARAESVVEADEVRASHDRVTNSINLLQNDISAADQRLMQNQQELNNERARRARCDDALKNVSTILRAADSSIGELSSSVAMSSSASSSDDSSVAHAAVECAKRAATVIADLRQSSVVSSANKSVSGADVASQTLRIGVGVLHAGDAALFIPRVTREMTGSSSCAVRVRGSDNAIGQSELDGRRE
jgi:chromosome segregation ATPase